MTSKVFTRGRLRSDLVIPPGVTEEQGGLEKGHEGRVVRFRHAALIACVDECQKTTFPSRQGFPL